jgi:putative endonuclease
MNDWSVYIIETDDGLLYTGISTDPDRRLQEHRSGKKGAKFFAGRSARSIVFIEGGYSRGEALKREYQIKSLSKNEKRQLINESAKK